MSDEDRVALPYLTFAFVMAKVAKYGREQEAIANERGDAILAGAHEVMAGVVEDALRKSGLSIDGRPLTKTELCVHAAERIVAEKAP